MKIASTSAICLFALTFSACSETQDVKALAVDLECSNAPLMSFRHLLDGEFPGVKMGDISVSHLVSEREVLIHGAAQIARSEGMSAAEIATFQDYWRAKVPDPATNQNFYRERNLVDCPKENVSY